MRRRARLSAMRRRISAVIVGALSIMLCLATGGCDQRHQESVLTANEDSLFKAAATGDTSEVKRLLDQGTNVDAREEEKETPLMYAVTEGRTDVVNLLLDRGASINAVSANGETALARAVGRSQYETVNILLNRGAEIEKSTDGKRNTIDGCRWRGEMSG